MFFFHRLLDFSSLKATLSRLSGTSSALADTPWRFVAILSLDVPGGAGRHSALNLSALFGCTSTGSGTFRTQNSLARDRSSYTNEQYDPEPRKT